MIKLGLAPMDGITDFPMRLWIALCGSPSHCSAPFVRITDTFPHQGMGAEQLWPEVGYAKGLVPYNFVPQVMASSLNRFLQVSERFLPTTEIIELNAGCPAPTVVGHNAGSSLLREQSNFSHWMEQSTKLLGAENFRVKMRIGFENSSEWQGLLNILQQHRVRTVTIHARTRAQHYSGRADWSIIDESAKKLGVKVIGSGDICSKEDASTRAQLYPNISEQLIGRGALRNPWLFSIIKSAQQFSVNRSTLVMALKSYIALLFLHMQFSNKLQQIVETGIFLAACNASEEKWHLLHELLYYPSVRQDLMHQQNSKTARLILGRTKMLWSFMRTSLGEDAMNAAFLRAKTFDEFFAVIAEKLGTDLHLQHRPEYDYLYQGKAF